jgi:hypothetical protein
MTDIPMSNAKFGEQKVLTEYPKLPERKLHPFEPHRDLKCRCVHCNKEFPSMASKNSHLQHCPGRFLNRFYLVSGENGTFLFTLQLNPLKRRRAALQKLITDFKNSSMFLGAVAYLKNTGVIRDYAALQLEDSIDLLEMGSGRILYGMLKKTMSQREMDKLEAQVVSLNEGKLKWMADHFHGVGATE